jgi:hypothetical protein
MKKQYKKYAFRCLTKQVQPMIRLLCSTTLLYLLLIPGIGFCQQKTFIREYIYKASETDSKVSSRQKALQEVKALLIEELGTYVESYVNYQVTEENNKITKDFFTNEIKTLSAGTTELIILEENWDGYEYYVKSEIKADPNEIITRINQTLSIREKNLSIDSLKTLLNSSNSQMQLKDAELAELQKKVTQQNQLVISKESEVKNLQKQLADAKSNLSVYETQKQQVLTEIQKIEQKINSATRTALDNVRIGMTLSEVSQVCGIPRTKEDCSTHIFYNYGNVWVYFESGIVVSVFYAKNYNGACCGSCPEYRQISIK